MRILIAEDDKVSRTLLERSLQRLGHEVAATEDGAAAWLAYEAGDFDVVISDWMMPGVDGLELCRRVRSSGRAVYTYFILLTALEGKANFVQGMRAGADDYLTKPLDREALEARLIAAERVVGLHRQLTEQNRALETLSNRLYEEGRVDPLTRVGNRLRMHEDLAAMHDRVARYGHRYAVALCDIDFFKKYNDTCGHQAGDETLATVAQTLAHQVRTGDSVYRYGGEEFLLLFPEQDLGRAAIAMERIRAAVEGLGRPHPGKDPAGVVTISCGLACFKMGDELTVEQLLGVADAALYRAKEMGRNQVVLGG